MSHRKFNTGLIFLFLLNVIFYSVKLDDAFALDSIDEIDSGMHEPLFIDLVRPIDSKKGQLEVNSLCYGKSKIACSPEIEYVVEDGLGFELELPINYNGQLESIKTAVQKRLNSDYISKRYDHGFQVIGEKNLHGNGSSLTLFYISGYNKRDISLVMLNGFKKSSDKYSLLLNSTLYKNYNQNFAYGIEVNYDQKGDVRYRILPQIKIHFSEKYEIQGGIGIEDQLMISAARMIMVF
jgi:hypothetical protein